MGKCSEGYSGLNPVKNDDIMRMLTILTIFAERGRQKSALFPGFLFPLEGNKYIINIHKKQTRHLCR